MTWWILGYVASVPIAYILLRAPYLKNGLGWYIADRRMAIVVSLVPCFGLIAAAIVFIFVILDDLSEDDRPARW